MTKTYLISDTHFGHRNIIEYCHRPFKGTHEMNQVMQDSWNSTVNEDDLVYFVGDLGLTKTHSTKFWLDKLKGKIVFVKGNHDDNSISSVPHTLLEYGGKQFYVVHYPNRVPQNWNHWVIHGHKHNNDMEHFPFINGVKRTVNVSVELIGYKPIALDEIVVNLDSVRRQDRFDSLPERF